MFLQQAVNGSLIALINSCGGGPGIQKTGKVGKIHLTEIGILLLTSGVGLALAHRLHQALYHRAG